MNEPIRIGDREIYTGIDLGDSPITSFTGQYRFLANPWPCQVAYEDLTYPSAEHAFQAAKNHDLRYRNHVASLPDWRDAKRAGRQVQLRYDWPRVRRAVMLQVVLAKFLGTPSLGDGLVATGQCFLLEGNWWGDTDWGAVKDNHPKWTSYLPWWHHGDTTWAGNNWLGITLTFTRDVLAPEDPRDSLSRP